MSFVNKIAKKNIASGRLWRQILGSLIEWNTAGFLAFLLIVIPISFGISLILSPGNYIPFYFFLALNLVVWLIIKSCRRLSGVFSLNKKEAGITWCQIAILAAVIAWIVGFVLIFHIHRHPASATVFGVAGSVAGWIFQDKLKGVVAFVHLRMHHLLNIDDWIQVPKYNADGEVKAVTLTTVTILNWDTTTSTIPISALQSDHFINLQNMADGKTYGRRMIKTFILDTECFHPVSAEEAEKLRSDSMSDVNRYLPAEEIKAGALNAHLFRIYLHHWLMANPHVSQKPHLIVRWMDQNGFGMPLQVYAFLLESEFCSFEWLQSRITEQIIESMGKFGLMLFQAPSADNIRIINGSEI